PHHDDSGQRERSALCRHFYSPLVSSPYSSRTRIFSKTSERETQRDRRRTLRPRPGSATTGKYSDMVTIKRSTSSTLKTPLIRTAAARASATSTLRVE